MYGKSRLYRRFRKPRWDGRGFADPGGRSAPNRHRTDTPRRSRNGFGICAGEILLWLVQAAARRGRAAVSAAPRKASPAFRLRLSVYRSADKARAWSDGLAREACSSGCGGFPRSRLAVPARRRFRCAAVECVCPPAVPRRSGNGVPAPVCVSPRRSLRSGSAPPMRSSAFAPPIFCERCAAAPNAAGFLRLAQTDGGMAFTGRFSDAERSLTALFERANRRSAQCPPQMPWPYIPRRAAAARLAPRRCGGGRTRPAEDSHKNNPNKPECRGDFRRKAGKRPYSPKTGAAFAAAVDKALRIW